jgi:hypothetical protein
MKNPYKLGDVVRAKTDNGHYYKAGAVGTVCQWDGDAPKEDGSEVWVDFNHPDSPFPVYKDGIWSAGVDQLESVASKFTVILLRPDYLTGNYGQDTYMTTVDARGPTDALKKARERVIEGDNGDVEEFLKDNALTDYHCIAVIAGDHKDLNPEM